MAKQIFEEIFATHAEETEPGFKSRGKAAMSFEEQVKAQMDQLREQQKAAEEMRAEDKKRMQQSLKDKLKARSELKKQKAEKSEGSRASATAAPKQPTAASIPATKKEALYSKENIELFRDLEKYAVGNEVVARSDLTFDNLMEKLMIAQLLDLEKVRILFHWITGQNLNALSYSGNIVGDSPLGYFQGIRSDKNTYAALFERLCRAAGIQAKVVTGYLKGAGYYPDYKFGDNSDPFRGSWNAVLLDGQWRLVDTNWGSRHVTEEGEARSDSGQPEYKYEEHYFMSDPDHLINTHFPDEHSWQLMKKAITLKEFEKMPKLWPLFFKIRLDLHSHKDGLIVAEETGYVKIQLKVSAFARTDAKLKAELRPRAQEAVAPANELQRHIFQHNDDELEVQGL